MAIVKVYRYDYFDTLIKHDRRSTHYATADAIAELHGRVLAESVREVDEDLLDERGMILPQHMPLPAEALPPPGRNGRRPAA